MMEHQLMWLSSDLTLDLYVTVVLLILRSKLNLQIVFVLCRNHRGTDSFLSVTSLSWWIKGLIWCLSDNNNNSSCNCSRWKIRWITPFRRFTTSTTAPTVTLPVGLLTMFRGRWGKKNKNTFLLLINNWKSHLWLSPVLEPTVNRILNLFVHNYVVCSVYSIQIFSLTALSVCVVHS